MRRPLIVALGVAFLASSVGAQEVFLPKPVEQIEGFLDLLDAVDSAQIVILEDPLSVTDENLEDLRELVRLAEDFGSEDVAARARTLIVIASFARTEAPPEAPPVEGGLVASQEEPLARNTQAFRRWVNVGATAGASALGMSAVFYFLAERNYQEWLTEADPTLSAQLYRAWQGYDYLGLGLGTATLLSVGVGLPLVFSLTPPSTTLATPPAAQIFTPEAKNAELDRLYAERATIVRKLNELNDREDRRSLVNTISLGAGVAGAILAGTFYYLADQAYDLYLVADNPTDAQKYSRRVSAFDILAASGAGLGGAGFGYAATVGIVTKNRVELERDLERVNTMIIRVRASKTINAPDPDPIEETARRRRRNTAADEPVESAEE